jgi:DNA-binding FrmR family transcriptional regulator
METSQSSSADRQTKRRKVRARVNRIAGQVAGIGRMVEEDRYCVDILNQIAAARSALDALGIELLTQHVETCVVGHGSDSEHHCAKPMGQQELLAELQTALSRFLK